MTGNNIRRGVWKPESVKKEATVKSGRFGARPATVNNDGLSNSESHLAARGTTPVSSAVVAGVSEHRQEELIRATDMRQGDSKYPTPVSVVGRTRTAGIVSADGQLNKSAGIVSTDGRFNSPGGNTVRMAPEVYSPLFQIANLQLPRDRITCNAWNRNFYATHPIVHNCINLHATYPINKIHIKCKYREVEDFFNGMDEELDLIKILQDAALEFWVIGECFPYAELDETRGTWKSIIIQNPDYMHVKTSVLGNNPVISMRPDAALQRLVMSNNPADMQLRNQIDEEILFHIRKGNNIPFDNFHVSHLKMPSHPYDVHGTSLIVDIYKDLMLFDKLRESQFAMADGMVNPITLVKVGGSEESSYHPTSDDLEKWRQTFEAAQYDRDFKIITHGAVTVERIGAAGQIKDISPELAFIVDDIFYGLLVPKAIVTQDGAAFNSASIGLEVLKQRYEQFRNMMGQWLVKKIFAPISEIQDFYSYKDGVKKLIVPEIEWNKMVLFDMDNYIQILNTLATAGTVSQTTLFKSLGLSVQEERRNRKEEMIYQAIIAKEIDILNTMSLGALRALKPDEDIIEQTVDVLPGTTSATSEDAGGLPGTGPMPSGMGGMGGGGGLGGAPSGPAGGLPSAPAPVSTPPAGASGAGAATGGGLGAGAPGGAGGLGGAGGASPSAAPAPSGAGLT